MDITERMNGNLLEPLTMPESEAIMFAGRHVCAICFGNLYAWGEKIFCYTCGPVYQHTYISKHMRDSIEHNYAAARIEMRSEEHKQPRSAEEILKELGF